ncbi:uncharacterized protein LOC127706387 isoform X2 [Mytilus californianus]|uniref:uncharacterized protein LOC127706387 isoform X2 n=1 Tax=Mytilus californianus TaxID=6549 RepID=UPI0022464E4C|nr:uncharacterized protein LOC127706387 isoform X2 [Mytilus californianus]
MSELCMQFTSRTKVINMTCRICSFFLLLSTIGAHRLSCQFADYSVSLSCNISASIKTVSLIDNHGNDVARCALKGSSGNCSSKDFVKSVIRNNVVIFHVHRNRTTDLNGNWFCSQENIMYRPEILSSKDKTASTIVNLVGKIVQEDDTQRLLLTCSSCRTPNENHAEFLINDNSVDSITYNNATGKCTYSYGECSRRECNCSSSGNEFSRFFVLKKQLNTKTYFSCDIRFHIKDEEQLVVFSKVSTLSFNGTDFTDRGTRTVIIKLTDINNRPKDKDSNTANILIPVISASVIMVTILLTVAVYCNRKGRRREKKKNIVSDEDIPLLDTNDKTVQVHPKELDSSGTHDQYVQVNFDADNFLFNSTLPESNTTRETDNRCVHVFCEADSLLPNSLFQLSNIKTENHEETDDEDYVQAPDDLTSESIHDRIETESKQNNDTINKSISPQPTTGSQSRMKRLD